MKIRTETDTIGVVVVVVFFIVKLVSPAILKGLSLEEGFN